MNLRRSMSWLTTRKQTEVDMTVTAAEAEQLDLLLGELATNEQALTPTYWESRAQAFTDHVALLEGSKKAERAARLSQLKPYLVSALPLGGLIALGVALTTPTATEPTVANQEAATMVVAATAVEEVSPETPALANETSARPSPAVQPQAPRIVGGAELAASNPQKRTVRKAAKQQRSSTTSDDEALATTKLEAPAVYPMPTTTEVLAKSEPKTTSVVPITSAGTPPVAPPVDTFTEQVAALKLADKALKGGDSESAKAALSRSFSPQLTLHANALRAVLACQTNDLTAGKRYLAAQVKSHPNSPYLGRMQRACGVAESASAASRKE